MFQKGRDNWREKALEKQTKMRNLEIKVRDVSNSRENWKACTLAAEKKLKSLEMEKIYQKKAETSSKKDNEEGGELSIKHHHYDAQTIQQALKMLIDCGVSLRGAEKVFELFQNDRLQTIPSFTGIRKWLGRIGMYEFKRENEYRDDWIFIVDFTVELGNQKALVIFGVSQKYFQEEVIDQNRSCLIKMSKY